MRLYLLKSHCHGMDKNVPTASVGCRILWRPLFHPSQGRLSQNVDYRLEVLKKSTLWRPLQGEICELYKLLMHHSEQTRFSRPKPTLTLPRTSTGRWSTHTFSHLLSFLKESVFKIILPLCQWQIGMCQVLSEQWRLAWPTWPVSRIESDKDEMFMIILQEKKLSLWIQWSKNYRMQLVILKLLGWVSDSWICLPHNWPDSG